MIEDRPAVEGRTAAVRDMICLDRSSRALRATTEPPLFGRRFFFFRFGEVVRVDSMVGLLDRYVGASPQYPRPNVWSTYS